MVPRRIRPLRACTRTLVAFAAAGVLSFQGLALGPAGASGKAVPDIAISVKGNRLVDALGKSVRLLGVNRSGTEYACEQGWGIFDGPSDAESIAAIAAWHVNAVRIPLNEGCWLGEYTTADDPAADGADPTPFEGAAYRSAIVSYVALLHRYRMVAILCLSALDAPDGLGVPPMADATYSATFWSSVAKTFRTDRGVLFDLYNEPNGISWSCWLDGCQVQTPDGPYQSVGMQALVTAVRKAGAAQPIMLGGLGYAGDDSQWAAHLPRDPAKSLVVSFHTYNSTSCSTPTCWDRTIVPLARDYPVVTGEVGEYDCSTGFTDRYLSFADAKGISYLGWAWDAIAPGSWSCTTPALITDYAGDPSPEGAALHSHLAELAARKELPPIV